MEKILTVTVPAYNAEPYLEYCLDSLCLPDLLDKVEIIVVDDGSQDLTGQLADQYMFRFPGTVRVIHKENGGHGSGINCGIQAAKGRYFKIVDADDWVDAQGFRNLVGFLEHSINGSDTSENISDLIVSGFYWAFDDGSGEEENFCRKPEIKEPFPGVVYNQVYYFDQIAKKIYVKMHALTIRTELLQNNMVRIDENCFYVDMEYILFPIPYAATITFIRDFVYQYRIGRQGQSVDPDRMVRLQADYDRVLKALFAFYRQCRSGCIPCSHEKCDYIARIIARAVAGKIKILLSLPIKQHVRKRLISFDKGLKKYYPSVYKANCSKGFALLRFSGYRLYMPACWLLRIRNRRR